MKPRPWTEQEIRQFKQLYPNSHNKDLAKKFKRSIHGIRKKAIKLGIKKDTDRGYRSPRYIPPDAWTKKEVQILRRMYRTSRNQEIATKLGRTLAAVDTKIRKLGLSQTPKVYRWTDEHIEYVRKNYYEIPIDLIAQQLGRSVEGVRKMAHKSGISRTGSGHKSKKREWTDREDAVLERYFYTQPVERIAEKLNRTAQSIKARAYRLHMLKQNRWTRQEILKLEHWLPDYSREEVAAMLGRTLSSVIAKQKRLGLRRFKPWTKKEIAILKKFFPIESNVSVARRLKKSAPTIALKARELGLRKSVRFKYAKGRKR